MSKQIARRNKTDLQIGPFQLTGTGLIVAGEPSFAAWQDAGEFLGRAEGAIHWWIGDWLNYGHEHYPAENLEEYEATLAALPFERKTQEKDARVAKEIGLERRRSNLTHSHHAEVAALSPDEQNELLDAAEKNEWTRQELRKQIRQRHPPATPLIPEDQYRVVVADPPWCYSDKLIEGYGAAEHHYSALTVDQLCKLSGPDQRAITDCFATPGVLFLWATCPMLPEALQLIEGWGYEYKANFIWDKVKHNYGHYNSVRHEFLLVATRGSCLPDAKTLHDSVISIERSEKHSEKPGYIYDMIESLYQIGPYLELFARTKRNGWTTWGNELEHE